MSYVLIVILFVKQNILILHKRNPRVTKTSHMWKNLLIFFFCILIIDIYLYFGGALRKELLCERSRTNANNITTQRILHIRLWSYKVLFNRVFWWKRQRHPKPNINGDQMTIYCFIALVLYEKVGPAIVRYYLSWEICCTKYRILQ